MNANRSRLPNTAPAKWPKPPGPTWLKRSNDVKAMSEHAWGNAYTRSLLGVRLGLGGSGNWSMVKAFAVATAGRDRRPRAGRRRPGQRRDARSACTISSDARSSRSTSPTRGATPTFRTTSNRGSGTTSCRDGTRRATPRFATARCSMSETHLTRRYGCPPDTMVLVRPDDHVAAIQPMSPGVRASCVSRGAGDAATGRLSPRDDLGLLPVRRLRHPDHRRGQRHRRGACPALRARRRDRDCRRPAPRPRCSAQLDEPAHAAGSTCARSTFRTRPPSPR